MVNKRKTLYYGDMPSKPINWINAKCKLSALIEWEDNPVKISFKVRPGKRSSCKVLNLDALGIAVKIWPLVVRPSCSNHDSQPRPQRGGHQK